MPDGRRGRDKGDMDGMRNLTRRAALLGAAGLLTGCETISDSFDSIFGSRKVRLTGERQAVLPQDRQIQVDEGAAPLSLPPPQELAEWPQAGGTPGHAPGHPALGRPLAEAWRVSVGTGSAYRRRLIAPPVVASGHVFTMDAYGVVTAVDAASGGRRWQFDTSPDEERGGALGGGVAFADGVLYVATGMAEVLALDPANGSPRWRAKLPAPARGAPTVAEGRILVPTIENQLLALKTEDGARIWVHRAQSVTAMALGMPAPAVEGDAVVAGFGSGELVAIRLSTGRPLWSELLGTNRGGLAEINAVTALPVIDRGRVFATGLGGITIAIDLRSGRRLWERDFGSAETPWVVGDAVFVLTSSDELLCLGRDDGLVRWVAPLQRFENEEKRRDPVNWGPPLLAGGRLLISSSLGQILELDPASGEITGRTPLPGGARLQPAVAGGSLYLLTEDAVLVAMRGRG